MSELQTADSPVAVQGTRPYAWPWDQRLTTTSFALVVVTGSSAGASGEAPEGLLADCIDFAGEIAAMGFPVVWAACSGSAPPNGAPAGHLHADSPTANAMIGGDLDLVLRTRGIDRFALAGWPLETSVHSTMRRANDLGYECLLLEDLCQPLDPGLRDSAISQVLMSGGIFGAVGTAADLSLALKTSTPQGAPR